jgi:C4-dicarboxylate-specific signal transduction histidine kinase
MAEARLSAFNKELEASVNERTAALDKINSKLICETAERIRVDGRLNELQAELFHASRLSAAGQMAAALAHELNQPLAAAANFVNAARRMHASNTSHHTISYVLSEASAEVLRAGQIIHRLREFLARGDTERRVENVKDLIEDACALALTGSRALGVQINFDLDLRASFVIVNRIQIQQVLTNLMRNAFEAVLLTDRREVGISTALRRNRAMEIAISDSGPGFANLEADRLFQPFVSTKRDGMGLGLCICRSIVEAHGGTLHGESRMEGGAIFRFTLPLAQVDRDARCSNDN